MSLSIISKRDHQIVRCLEATNVIYAWRTRVQCLLWYKVLLWCLFFFLLLPPSLKFSLKFSVTLIACAFYHHQRKFVVGISLQVQHQKNLSTDSHHMCSGFKKCWFSTERFIYHWSSWLAVEHHSSLVLSATEQYCVSKVTAFLLSGYSRVFVLQNFKLYLCFLYLPDNVCFSV